MKQTLLNVRKAKKKFKQLVSFASRLIISLISSLLKNPVKFSFSSIYGKPDVSVSVCGFKAGLGHTAQARFTMRLPSCKSVVTLAHGRSPARPRLIYTLWGMMGRHSGRQLLLRVWTSLQQRLRGGSDFSSGGGQRAPLETVQGKRNSSQQSLPYSTVQGRDVGWGCSLSICWVSLHRVDANANWTGYRRLVSPLLVFGERVHVLGVGSVRVCDRGEWDCACGKCESLFG